jgi:hypothetical protein
LLQVIFILVRVVNKAALTFTPHCKKEDQRRVARTCALRISMSKKITRIA